MNSPSTVSSAALVMYSCARWIGLRVWNPTTVCQPLSAKRFRVSAGVSRYGVTASMCDGRAFASIGPAIVRAPSRSSAATPGCASSVVR
jgi:hypothetical protein